LTSLNLQEKIIFSVLCLPPPHSSHHMHLDSDFKKSKNVLFTGNWFLFVE
jgi:hypothetical protein